MPDALELLKTRRSVKPIELIGPGPTASEIDTLLRIASRSPGSRETCTLAVHPVRG